MTEQPPGAGHAAAGSGQDPGPAAALAGIIPRLAEICGADTVITDPMELRTYESDGLTAHRCSPGVVVLPETAAQVAAVVRACAGGGVPFVARGSGTGLSGGALPRADGVLIVTARMRRIIEVDPASRRAIVEPGVTNLAVSKAALPFGLFYAPDPSSQQICSVGGNVAENSGGAHCLKHGFTRHHVTGLEIVTPDGDLTWLGDGTGTAPGYDLLGAFTGSEGTLGIATKIVVRLTPIPQAVTTLLAAFETTGHGGAAVSAIIGAGILPAAIEMMDALSIAAAEAAVRCRYPEGAGAVLIVELDGPEADVRGETAAVRTLCEQAGRRPGRTGGDLDRPAVRVRRGRQDLARLHRPGRCRTAHGAARGARPDQRAVGAGRDQGRERVPCRRRQPAPAGAVRRLQPRAVGGGRYAVRRDPGRVHRPRRVDHRRARRRRRQVQVHVPHVRRRRPGHDAVAALRVRPGRPVQSRQGLPDAADVRRGPRHQARPASAGGLWPGGDLLIMFNDSPVAGADGS